MHQTRTWYLRIVLICLVGALNYCCGTRLDSSKFEVWGPGLRSGYVVPARFFYIQAVDSEGNNVTSSLGKDPFTVELYEGGNSRMRAWVQQLDRQDGSYIVRFKLFESQRDVKVSITYNGEQVGKSAHMMEGDVYHDQCDCPTPTLTDWYDNMQCPTHGYRQIKQDLSLWPGKIDMKVVAKEAVARFNQRGSHSLCHYVVKDNKIYRKTYGEHVGFKMFMDAILLSLTRKVHLPDFELFSNLGDWPLEKKKANDNPLPIFSWCGSDDTQDIVMPTYDVTESTLQTMGRVTLDLLSVQGNTGPEWANKSDIALWRGRDSRQERLDLVRMSNKHPDVIDAKLTNMFFFKKADDLPQVKHISFFDFFKYKYQLNIDGTVAAYRFPYLMAANSLVLKQDSPWYEHFYKDLKPYEHYVPFKRDLSDLLTQLQWAKDHDDEVQKITRNAQEFVRNNLMSGDIFCYHVKLFEAYAKKLSSPVEVLPDMELVEQAEDRSSYCDCHRKPATKKKDEL